ncbi:undecaprenyl-diphosphate phosphatase [Dongia deserti]|uniref:undecaprenyl-diphosphate phosphatase n=1 Tax=Dongia deserti TaxID=2268030 RepID=UPI0013C3FA9F|nr:undecaprenyl-diphosphate phosphatase [Dongia deserti]
MPNIDILVLAILQGATEFLPVGSSGHLILVPQLYCWGSQAPGTELAALLGALLAVTLCFAGDLIGMLQGFLKVLQGKRDGRVRLIGLLLVAAIPYLVVAFLVERYAGDALRSPMVIGDALVIFGLLLYGADKFGLTVRRVEHMTFGQALTFGVLQCCAVIPGASATGITMTTGRVLGYERPDAVRFAFLLSIPILVVTAVYKGWLVFQSDSTIDLPQAGLAFGLSAITGLLAIAFISYWVRRSGFVPFVVYRVALGVYLLYLFYLAGGPSC